MLRGKKVEIFALILYTFAELFGSAFINEQRKCTPYFSDAGLLCYNEKCLVFLLM